MRNALLLSLLICVAGCNSNKLQSPADPQPVADTTTTAPAQPTADAPALPDPNTDSTRLAERLEELDRRIATAPPESVEALDAEYRHVIDSAMAAQGKTPEVITGPEGNPTSSTNQPTESTVRRQPGDTAIATATEPAATPTNSTVRRQPEGSGTSTPHHIDDPSKVFKGLRPDELRTAPAYRESSSSAPRRNTAAAPPQTRVRRSRAAAQSQQQQSQQHQRKQQRADQRVRESARTPAAAPPSVAPPREPSERQLERQYIDGVASARAGNYADAASKLEPVVNSPLSKARREEARYYYARSLEGLGRTNDALRNYNTVSNGSGNLKHRAYLDYCRLLASNGQKERARTMLRQFIRQHPSSRQTPDAQALLQTL